MHPPPASKVEAIFRSYPPGIRRKLFAVRALILDVASSNDAIGPITETLKWGEPAYLTEKSRSGSTIRLGWKASCPAQYAVYFNCNTTLVDTFRSLFPELSFSGNRALLFAESAALPTTSVARCIELALTYHLDKRRRRTQ